MNTALFYKAILVFHITGLTMMAGTTLVDFVVFKQFWKQYAIDKAKGIAIVQAFSKLPVLMGLGMGFLILSGIGMMALTNGIFGEQLWFRIKMGFVVLIIVNGLVFGRRAGMKLRKTLLSEEVNEQELAGLKNRLRIFHLFQLCFFLVIFVLSSFRFN